MRYITIFGAGLLIGTALAVIIPEGIHALYSSQNSHDSSHSVGKNIKYFNSLLT
jgi:solute carrier family 39 (zinc transporter), member 9